jgi:hypothetical protein
LTYAIQDFTSYKSANRGIWPRSDTLGYLIDFKLADNAVLTTLLAFKMVLQDSLVVGRSKNTRPDDRRGRSGMAIYDGPAAADRVHVAGFDGVTAFVYGE